MPHVEQAGLGFIRIQPGLSTGFIRDSGLNLVYSTFIRIILDITGFA